jgi:hypothetical protein
MLKGVVRAGTYFRCNLVVGLIEPTFLHCLFILIQIPLLYGSRTRIPCLPWQYAFN